MSPNLNLFRDGGKMWHCGKMREKWHGRLVCLVAIATISEARGQHLGKCCALGQSLHIPENAPPSCVASENAFIYHSISVDLPKCQNARIVRDVAAAAVTCLDKNARDGSVVGIKCADQWQPYKPTVAKIRKCCPPNREYDLQSQTCSHSTPNNETIENFVQLVSKGKSASTFLDISFGSPKCPNNYVTADSSADYRNVSDILENYALKLSDNTSSSADDFCLDLTGNKSEMAVVRYCDDIYSHCEVDKKTCVRKCCPDGQIYGSNRTCQPSESNISLEFNDASPRRDVAYIYGDPCEIKKYILRSGDYYFVSSGEVLINGSEYLDRSSYCVEFVNTSHARGTKTFRCFRHEDEMRWLKWRMLAITILATASCFFLLITFVVYALLPSLRNLHGKSLMCYLISLFGGYSMVVAMQVMDPDRRHVLCFILAYIMLFSFLSSFCWMNVICFDIWSTFGAVRSGMMRNRNNQKRFLMYCAYGWLLPSCWTVIAGALQNYKFDIVPESWIPDIGTDGCWFREHGASKKIFFTVPVSLMIFFNLVLYIMTAIYCSRVRNELVRVKSNDYKKKRFVADKKKIAMNTKLFVVMGVNWVAEMVSLLVPREQRLLWFSFFDISNSCCGIFIFLIFVVKKKVANDLQRRITGKTFAFAAVETSTTDSSNNPRRPKTVA